MTAPVAPPALVFGEGRPVILLHAFPLDGRIWLDQARTLSDRNQVIVPDLRGFGSAYAQLGSLAEIPIDLVADDLAALLAERGIPRAVVGGISRGGYIALAFARKYPEQLAGLMLFDTRANSADTKETQTYSELVMRLATEGISAAVDAMRTRLLGPETLARNPGLLSTVNAIIQSQKPDAVAAAALGMIHRTDARQTLAHIGVPVLAMAGIDDAAYENTKAIAAGIPGARFIAVPGAGHLSILEQPEFAANAMRDFLAGLTG